MSLLPCETKSISNSLTGISYVSSLPSRLFFWIGCFYSLKQPYFMLLSYLMVYIYIAQISKHNNLIRH